MLDPQDERALCPACGLVTLSYGISARCSNCSHVDPLRHKVLTRALGRSDTGHRIEALMGYAPESPAESPVVALEGLKK